MAASTPFTRDIYTFLWLHLQILHRLFHASPLTTGNRSSSQRPLVASGGRHHDTLPHFKAPPSPGPTHQRGEVRSGQVTDQERGVREGVQRTGNGKVGERGGGEIGNTSQPAIRCNPPNHHHHPQSPPQQGGAVFEILDESWRPPP